MFRPVTTLTAFATAATLFAVDFFYSDKIAAAFNVSRNWALSSHDFWAFANHASTVAAQDDVSHRVIVLGNSFVYAALGNAADLAQVIGASERDDLSVYDLTSGGQTIVETAAFLETIAPDENTTILFGINELSFASSTPGTYRNIVGLPFPTQFLDCHVVTCTGWSLRFHLRRLKGLGNDETPERRNRFDCEFFNVGCVPDISSVLVEIYADVPQANQRFVDDLEDLLHRLSQQTQATVLLLETPLNADFVKAVDNPVFFQDASEQLQAIGDRLDIPMLRSPGRSDEDAQYFQDYGHVANQTLRDEIVEYVGGAVMPFLPAPTDGS